MYFKGLSLNVNLYRKLGFSPMNCFGIKVHFQRACAK